MSTVFVPNVVKIFYKWTVFPLYVIIQSIIYKDRVMEVRSSELIGEFNDAVLNADPATRFIVFVLDENLIIDNIPALLPLVYENAAQVIAQSIPHLFQTHLTSWKTRHFDLKTHNNIPFPQKFTNSIQKWQAALAAAQEVLAPELSDLLKTPGVLGHSLLLDLPSYVSYNLLNSIKPIERAPWLKLSRKDGTNVFLKMTLEQIAHLSRGLNKNDRVDILNMVDVLGHNILHHIAIKRRNKLYYGETLTCEYRQKIYKDTLSAVSTLLSDLDPREQFLFLSLQNSEGFVPLHGLSGQELKHIIGPLPSDVRKELMELKTHIYDLDKGLVCAGVLEPVFHRNIENDDLITTQDMMDLTADFTPSQNASFFSSLSVNKIELMLSLTPHQQAQKLSTMNLEQKRPFLFPFALMQMDQEDIVQSVLNLPVDKKIQLLLHPAGITDRYLDARCVFDCLDLNQKARVILGIDAQQWQKFKAYQVPEPLSFVENPDLLLKQTLQAVTAKKLIDIRRYLEKVGKLLSFQIKDIPSVRVEQRLHDESSAMSPAAMTPFKKAR